MRITLWATFWSFLLDQASKYIVIHWLNLRKLGEIDVLPPFLNFRMAWNKGVNFGLFSNSAEVMRWVLIAIAVVICIWVLVWIWRETHSRMAQFSAGLLIGGALGNVIDRVLYGAVADFLNMSCCGIENPYSFNVADIFVFAGAIGLIIFASGKKTA